MATRGSFALVVERDTGTRARWAELVQAAGAARVLRRARPAEAADLLTPDTPLVALVAGLAAAGPRDADMLAFIAQTRRIAPDCVILAVDHGNRPHGPAEAFAAGVDDFMRGDHQPSEFEARLAARLRQSALVRPGVAHLARLGLTPVEERILSVLGDRPGKIVSRDTLARAVGEADWTYGDRRFDVHIARIRRKLHEAFGDDVRVRTIRGRGYQLESETLF